MITAFDVYLVMQLDAIGNALGVLGFLGLLLGCVGVVLQRAAKADGETGTAEALSIAPKLLAVGIFSALLNTALPTSKTAAAMIVIPAITSDAVVEQVTPEAKELYELAKDAMRELAKPKDK